MKSGALRAGVGGLFLGAVVCAGAAQAGVSGLTNTGVDLGSNSIDNAWSIVNGSSVPGLTYPSAVYADATNGVFPITGYWTPNTATSQWDTPFNPLDSNTDPSVDGSYIYQTQFSVTGAPSATNALSFKFAADNEVAWISLNGQTFYTGPTDGSSQYWNFIPATASNLLQSGNNTLQFDVVNYAQNGGNPSGLNVEFTSVSGVPEVSTWAMMLLGFAGLGIAASRGWRSRRGAISIA
jgi:hypothetical protein